VSIAPVAGATFSGVVATFTDANKGATLLDFNATINWGDGTSVVAGSGVITQPGGPGTPFVVSGTHVYANPAGSVPIAVTIHDAGGAATTAGAVAQVLVPLTGSVAPASLTSGIPGITRDTQPQFSGHVQAGDSVALLANGVPVGATTADSLGNWSITSGPLGDGRYQFTAVVFLPSNGAVLQTLALGAPLTIDTTGPTVQALSFDAGAQTLHVTFQDTASGMNLAGVEYLGNYQLGLANSATTFRANGITITPGPAGTGEVTANVHFNLGGATKPGNYVVTLMGWWLTDLAGNHLVEHTFVTFPQTTNSPNPNYVAVVTVNRNGTTSPPQQYIPLSEQIAAGQYSNTVQSKKKKKK
jgi:hypothetical protein